jgi:hypothetical protein
VESVSDVVDVAALAVADGAADALADALADADAAGFAPFFFFGVVAVCAKASGAMVMAVSAIAASMDRRCLPDRVGPALT